MSRKAVGTEGKWGRRGRKQWEQQNVFGIKERTLKWSEPNPCNVFMAPGTFTILPLKHIIQNHLRIVSKMSFRAKVHESEE
jgi:hypothetical protein